MLHHRAHQRNQRNQPPAIPTCSARRDAIFFSSERSLRCGHCITPYLRHSFLRAVVHILNFLATSLSGMLKWSRSSFSESICAWFEHTAGVSVAAQQGPALGDRRPPAGCW